MTVYNVHERPRAITANCDKGTPLWRAVDNLVGSHSPVTIDQQPVHERDVVIVWQEAFDRYARPALVGGQGHSHLRVIQFGGQPVSQWKVPGSRLEPGPFLAEAHGDELHIPPTVPDNLRGLVRDTLLPLFEGQGSRRVVLRHMWAEQNPTTFSPLLTTSDQKALAAIYRHPGIAEVWWLPVDPENAENFDFAAWIRAALDTWHGDDPERFPGAPDWARSQEWMTSEELQLQTAVEDARAESQRQQIEMDKKISVAESLLAEAQVRHDSKERILLTGTGNELVDAVHSMLEGLGFDVEDVDKRRAEEDRERGGRPRPKLEDLRVADTATSWEALVEVKGYGGGGKTSDFQKITRFVDIYQNQNNKLPSATWYVVNQFRDDPPDTRPQLMERQTEDVDVFVENVNGVLVDTRDLFILDRRVAAGELTHEEARRMLMSSHRRFSLDEVEGVEGNEDDDSA